MLQQPVRLGGLALTYALATSTLVLVTFLATNLVLTVIGGVGLGGMNGEARPATGRPPRRSCCPLSGRPSGTRTGAIGAPSAAMGSTGSTPGWWAAVPSSVRVATRSARRLGS